MKVIKGLNSGALPLSYRPDFYPFTIHHIDGSRTEFKLDRNGRPSRFCYDHNGWLWLIDESTDFVPDVEV